jgi:hypothetical protein
MSETTNVVETEVAQQAFLQDVPQATEELVTPVKTTSRTYTEEDVRKIREDVTAREKNKLYDTIESLKSKVTSIESEHSARQQEIEAARFAAEEEAKKKAEAEMDVRQLLEAKEKEWAEKLEQERRDRQQALSLLEKERQLAELNEYRSARLAQERDNVLPELLDLITGNTPEEIEQSIAGLKDRTSRILDNTQQAMQSARKEMTGSRITAPASGPLDTNSDQQQFTAEDISAMSVTEYAKYRSRLLGKASSNGNKGIFG